MDVSHTTNVADVIVREKKSGWRMKIVGKKEFLLENWSINKRKDLFEEVFGVTLEVDDSL
jgi:hypothetical protein